MSFPPPHLVTERLVLRLPSAKDADRIFRAYAQDPQVTRFMTWRPHRSIDDTRRFLEYCEQVWSHGGGEYAWVIERKDDGQLLGMIGVQCDPNGVRVGYVLDRPFWGFGYMTEALSAVGDAALNDSNIHRVWAFCDVENVASARVMEKAGLQFEGILRRFSVHPNLGPIPRDCRCYARVR